jgi:hypothetical protein
MYNQATVGTQQAFESTLLLSDWGRTANLLWFFCSFVQVVFLSAFASALGLPQQAPRPRLQRTTLRLPTGSTSHSQCFQVNSSLILKALEKAYQYDVIVDMTTFFPYKSYRRDIESLMFSKRGCWLLDLKVDISVAWSLSIKPFAICGLLHAPSLQYPYRCRNYDLV